jgi:hypothetical protein
MFMSLYNSQNDSGGDFYYDLILHIEKPRPRVVQLLDLYHTASGFRVGAFDL